MKPAIASPILIKSFQRFLQSYYWLSRLTQAGEMTCMGFNPVKRHNDGHIKQPLHPQRGFARKCSKDSDKCTLGPPLCVLNLGLMLCMHCLIIFKVTCMYHNSLRSRKNVVSFWRLRTRSTSFWVQTSEPQHVGIQDKLTAVQSTSCCLLRHKWQVNSVFQLILRSHAIDNHEYVWIICGRSKTKTVIASSQHKAILYHNKNTKRNSRCVSSHVGFLGRNWSGCESDRVTIRAGRTSGRVNATASGWTRSRTISSWS